MYHDDFYKADYNQPHPQRGAEMIRKYPQIKNLMGPNPATFLVLLFVVGLQVGLAWYLGAMGTTYWWASLIAAFCIGAFANHALYVLIHDATHNLIFHQVLFNKIAAILADLPNLMPGAMGFRVYHLKHHAHQGDYDYDADMAGYTEARLIGNAWWRKALWLLFFPLFQITRPPRLKAIKLWSTWALANVVAVLAFDAAVLYFLGLNGFLYLLFSFFFSIGLHPVGARWIQEHYTPDGEQETFSYYGPINIVALNVGYHNEHHDFPSIAWNRLPELKKIAPEYYDNLKYHTSWTKLLFQFIFDPHYDLFSRVERVREGKVSYDRTHKQRKNTSETGVMLEQA